MVLGRLWACLCRMFELALALSLMFSLKSIFWVKNLTAYANIAVKGILKLTIIYLYLLFNGLELFLGVGDDTMIIHLEKCRDNYSKI